MTKTKFLLIREIAAGLWNEMHHVLSQALAAEIMQRIPVVYWGKGSLYASSDGSNAFEQFFLPISSYSVHDLAKEEFSFYPERWNSTNILMPVTGSPEDDKHLAADPLEECGADVCVRDNYIDVEKIIPFIPEGHPLFGLKRRDLLHRLICKYIRLQKDVQTFIDAFFDENMKGIPFLAVHIRSSDKIVEVQHLHELNEMYPREIEKVLKANPGMRIFLMTDCIEILEEYKKRYGDLLIHTNCRRVPRNGEGVHFQEYPDNRVKGLEIIRDTWLAARCDFFIGNGYSNVSAAISELKNWKSDRIKLFILTEGGDEIWKKSKWLEMYKTMRLIRLIEQRINDEYKYDEIKTPIHLSIGQEAVAAGVCIHLRKDDYVFGTHRSHAQYIAKGGDIKKMIAELYLRKTGCAYGRGGSMHLVDPDVGILGSSAIVGGNIPLGTGTALASKLSKNDRVTVVFFGDGAADEGTFHESLNFASLKKLPVVYVCENNFYAINSHQLSRQVGDNIYKWAQNYGMPGIQIDGNDVMEVFDHAEKAISRCRNGEGPTLIECLTYRWKGHIGTVDDVGPGYRPKEEYDYWISKCPIKRFSEFLKDKGVLTDELIKNIDQEINGLIEEAFRFAQSSPKPSPEELLDFVYAD